MDLMDFCVLRQVKGSRGGALSRLRRARSDLAGGNSGLRRQPYIQHPARHYYKYFAIDLLHIFHRFSINNLQIFGKLLVD
jgi:hypothetical protein